MNRRWIATAIAMMLLIVFGASDAESAWSWNEEPTPALPLLQRLSGISIGIDPGHQMHQNSQQEAIAPGSKQTKPKVASGTAGIKTRTPEYQVNLEIAFQLRDALEDLGCIVYMTRETNDVDISNQERAIMMNEANVDLVLRLHCNGSQNRSANGIGLYVNATGAIAADSLHYAEIILPAMTEATGARRDGIFKRDTYTGLNWSSVPCILVEMGYMTNPEEDVKLNNATYQAQLVGGMIEGICRSFGR